MGSRRYGGIMIELVRRRMMMGGSAKPYDAEVEWVQGFPDYRLNIGVSVNNNGYAIKAKVLIPSSTEYVDVFEKGTDSGQSKNMWFLTFAPNNQVAFNVNLNFGYTDVLDSSIKNNIVDIDVLSNTVLIRWANKSTSMTVATPANDTGSLMIFSRKSRKNCIRLYSFKLYDPNGNIVSDLIPVRKGNVGYIYDKVSGRLLENIYTTGYTTYGPDK